jgi:hypothetical protein
VAKQANASCSMLTRLMLSFRYSCIQVIDWMPYMPFGRSADVAAFTQLARSTAKDPITAWLQTFDWGGMALNIDTHNILPARTVASGVFVVFGGCGGGESGRSTGLQCRDVQHPELLEHPACVEFSLRAYQGTKEISTDVHDMHDGRKRCAVSRWLVSTCLYQSLNESSGYRSMWKPVQPCI